MEDYCIWQYDDPDYNTWGSGCSNCFQFEDGGPEDNRFKYCPYCGEKIKEVAQQGGKD